MYLKTLAIIFPFLVFMFFALPQGLAQEDDMTTVEKTIKDRIKDSHDNNFLNFSFENDAIGGGTDENYTDYRRAGRSRSHFSHQ
jgi:hypothetical protein